MISLENRIDAFMKLGDVLNNIAQGEVVEKISGIDISSQAARLDRLIRESHFYNGWFTEANVRNMIRAIGKSLKKDNIEKWLKPYLPSLRKNAPLTIAVVMAGNIPAVGFHDFLTVLISGNRLLAKLSGDDNKLIPAIAELLIKIEPEFTKLIEFTEKPIKGFDAVIATGSDNTSRYFEYYFGKYPNLIRRNRNGVAVLTGYEIDAELANLAGDVFTYYGLGCRNVSKLIVPKEYDFRPMLNHFAKRKYLIENHKYFNNYEYNKAIFLVENTPHLDSGNLLLTEDLRIASPVSVLYYHFYKDEDGLVDYLTMNNENIQCVVSHSELVKNKIGFGKSQEPELWDYADGVDTLSFLLSLEKQIL
jgi:hypothetical protein